MCGSSQIEERATSYEEELKTLDSSIAPNEVSCLMCDKTGHENNMNTLAGSVETDENGNIIAAEYYCNNCAYGL